jgi:cysteinyl-tRNA synthetase
MDFTWDAIAAADQRVKQLRRHMAQWAPASTERGDAAKTYDARVREALANDLHMPGVVAIVNELDRDGSVPNGAKYALLVEWDQVLGLDLEREATSGWEPTAEMLALMAERDGARAAKDFAKADAIREKLEAMGLEVMDTPDGTRVRPRD